MASNNDYDPEYAGDIPSTIKAKQRQTAFDVTNLPPQYRTQSSTPAAPAGPVGRATQQLPGLSLNDGFSFGSSQTPYPTSFADIGGRIDPGKLGAPSDDTQQVAVPAQGTPAIPNLRDFSSALSFNPSQTPYPTSFAELGGRINSSALGGAPTDSQQLTTQNQTEPLAASGLASALSFKPSQTPSPRSFAELGGSIDPNTLGSIGASASPSPATQPAAPPPMASLGDAWRPVVGGADTSDGRTSIAGKIDADGTASFSNDKTDLRSAYGIAPVNAPRAQSLADIANVENAAGSGPSFAALGSAKNLGDGIGGFSQFNQGDAKLTMDRYQRAADLRQAYTEQDALADARRRAGIDASVTVVGDSSKPLTRSDLAQAGLDQQERQNDQQAILNAQNGISAGQAQRAAAQQARQAQNLEDLRVAATAPDATTQQKAAYAAANDPDGTKALARQAQLAQISASNARAAKDQSVAEANGRKVKGLPATLQKLEDEDIGIIGSTKTINGSLDKINSQIEDGTLQLGPWANTVSSVMNAFGASDVNSANFASFQTQLEKLRNDSLRLNKGTQTEGDAERAFNELFTNIKDRKIVQQRLKEISQYNNQAAQVKVALINNRRANQGLDPLDVDEVLARSGLSESQPANQQKSQAQPQQAQPQQQAQATQQQPAGKQPVYAISTAENFASLPHGAQFIDPQGNHRVKE